MRASTHHEDRIRCTLRALLGVALGFMLDACDLPKGDSEHCDDALEVLCNCASRPCEAENPPPLVLAMMRCDEHDVRPSDQENNVHICVAEGGDAICGAIDGLSDPGPQLCEADCSYNTTCTDEIYEACTDYQFRACDIPESTEAAP